MSHIEDFLGNFKSAEIAAMDQDKLKDYLKDITALEPKPLPKPLGKDKDDAEDGENEKVTEEDVCPIKPSKKRKSKKQQMIDEMEVLRKEFEL